MNELTHKKRKYVKKQVTKEYLENVKNANMQYDVNKFRALALKDGKLVAMINVYTGEHVEISFIEKVKILFR